MTVIARAVIWPVVLCDEGHRVVVAAVAVVDRAGGCERLAGAHVLGVEGLGEGRRVAAGQAAAGDRRRGRRGRRAVVALGVGGRRDRDRPRVIWPVVFVAKVTA